MLALVETSMPDVPETVSLLLTLFTGIGLAAAAGLRAFVPLLALGLAVRLERATVLEPFTGLGSGPVLVVLVLLVLAEHAGRYRRRPLPGRATHGILAALAGATAASALLVDLSPGAALLAGGSAGAAAALAVHRPLSGLRRAASSLAADGEPAGGAVTPTRQAVSSLLISTLALCVPIAAPMLVGAVIAGSIHMRRHHGRRRPAV